MGTASLKYSITCRLQFFLYRFRLARLRLLWHISHGMHFFAGNNSCIIILLSERTQTNLVVCESYSNSKQSIILIFQLTILL